MSAEPIDYHPTFYSNLLPYHHSNFWINFAPQELRFVGGTMTSQGSYATPNPSNDALVVYDARDNTGVARCMKIPTLPMDRPAYDVAGMPRVVLPSEYQLFGISNPNPLDVYAHSLTNQVTNASAGSNHEQDPTQIIMPKPLHRVPTTRQQHYHQRHHAHAKHQANNIKNKTRFSATGLSSNYMVVRDTKMSLSSAPSSPSAGSLGGSLGNGYHPHMPLSAAYCIPQYKGSSSSSSSCCSITGLKISSSSMSSYSSRSSMSSTPSLGGISPRKRRADDVTNGNREAYCRKEYCQRQCDGVVAVRCSCEACATDEVTARVDDVTIRDVRTEMHCQQQKRSKNDDDVVFVSAEPGHSARTQPKERPIRKAKKSARKAAHRQTAAAEQSSAQSYSSFPFVVPSSCVPAEPKDVGGRYFLRSAVKTRKNEEPASTQHQTQNSDTVQSIAAPFVLCDEIDDNNNSVTVESNNVNSELQMPRYHTRSVQKKANADQQPQQKLKVQADAPSIAAHVTAPQTPQQPSFHCDVSSSSVKSSNYQPASVIQSAVLPPSNCKQQYVPTSTESSPASEGAKETPRSSSSLKKLYDIHGIIGVGGGGTVYAGTRKADGVQVAIKQVPKAKVKRWGKLNDRVVPIEFELLYRASHSGHTGVIGMLDWYERRSTYILVMERPQPVIDLFDYLNQYGALPEATARAIFRQLAEAVLHCHRNGVVHRDIKDENVLLNLHTSDAKLIDFGCGTVLKNTPYTEFAGTPEFYPPEWFTHRRYYGQRVDAWSLGVLLFTMVEAEVPFQKEKDIVECNLRHKRATHLSESCKNLIAWMLQKDQDMRPTIEQALNHPWFREGEGPLRVTATQQATTAGVMGTDELYEKRLQHHQNGPNVPVKGSQNHHKVASVESPESPPRYAAQEALLYQSQTTCQAAHQNGGVYQTVCVAR